MLYLGAPYDNRHGWSWTDDPWAVVDYLATHTGRLSASGRRWMVAASPEALCAQVLAVVDDRERVHVMGWVVVPRRVLHVVRPWTDEEIEKWARREVEADFGDGPGRSSPTSARCHGRGKDGETDPR